MVWAHDGRVDKVDLQLGSSDPQLRRTVDGRLIALGDHRIVALDGPQAKEVSHVDEYVRDWITTATGEVLWVDASATLHRGTVAFTPAPPRHRVPTLDVGADRAGRVIVAVGGRDLFARDTGAWSPLTGLPEGTVIDRVASVDGDVYIGGSRGLWKVVGNVVEPVPLPPGATAEYVFAIASSAGHAIAYALGRSRVVRVDAGGVVSWDLAGEIGGEHVRALSVDTRGRVWVGVASGLLVLGPLATDVRRVPLGTVDALSGELSSLVIVGDGPSITPGPVTRQPVKGRFTDENGAPIASTSLELCPGFDVYAKPFCSTSRFVYRTTTGADGSFAFDDVPVGSYDINVLAPHFDRLLIVVEGMTRDAPFELKDGKLSPHD